MVLARWFKYCFTRRCNHKWLHYCRWRYRLLKDDEATKKLKAKKPAAKKKASDGDDDSDECDDTDAKVKGARERGRIAAIMRPSLHTRTRTLR
jgi:hypothetical protein